MNNEQINQRIAEACGWTDFVMHPEFGLIGTPPDSHGLRTAVDWYTVDLNAMHEAEKLMDEEQWQDYVEYIGGTWEKAMHATAGQRAEAFLRTFGTWNHSGERTEKVKEVQK